MMSISQMTGSNAVRWGLVMRELWHSWIPWFQLEANAKRG